MAELTDKVPPQALEAEMAVLGSMLIEKEAVERALDVVKEPDFYKESHRAVFRAIHQLFDRGEAADVITVAEELRKSKSLTEAGGPAFLTELVHRVSTAAHVEHYARIVRQKAVLRELITAATQIVGRCYGEEKRVEELLEDAEAKIFAIAQKQTDHGFKSISELTHTVVGYLEDLHKKKKLVTGVGTGFEKFDRMTAGLQKSDLIILAARPSQGKTAMALNVAEHVGIQEKLPVAIFSLEMTAEQLSQRLLCSQARANLHDIRRGFFRREDWATLTSAAARIAEAPIYIDASPGLSVLDVRTRTRRLASQLKNEKGQDLALVVVDYLQLLRGSRGAENRQQEVSEISRSLKFLAKDLNIPVLALSQLSRRVEEKGREGRPQLSDLRECVTGDTLVNMADGRRAPIQSLVGTRPSVLAMSREGRIMVAQSDKVWHVGRRPVFSIQLASGRRMRCTARHRLFSAEGWRRVSELKASDRIAIGRMLPEPEGARQWPEDRLILLGQLIGDGSYLSGQPLRYTTSSEENSRAVAAAARTEFGVEVKRYRGRRSWHQLLLSGNGNRWEPKGVNRWLRDLGIFGQRSYEKQVPAEIFSLKNQQIGIFVRHLWATDGTIFSPEKKEGPRTGNKISYSTNSRRLADDVAALLLRLGIVARIYLARKGSYRPNYHVTISGAENQRLFLEKVGAFGPRVSQAGQLSRAIENVRGNTNVDTLPPAAFERVRKLMRERGISQRQMAALRGTSYGGTSHFSFAPSRAVLADYAEILEDDILRNQAASDIFWDTVAAVEPAGEDDVYDLTVPGPSSWLADGIVSHNSGAIEQDADLVAFIYREASYRPADPDLENKAELIIAKQRNGPTGDIPLHFIRHCTRFENPAHSAEEPAAEAEISL